MSEISVKDFFAQEDPLNNKIYPCSEVETYLFDERDMMIFAERYCQEKKQANEASTSHDIHSVSNPLPDHVVKFRLEELEIKYDYLMEQYGHLSYGDIINEEARINKIVMKCLNEL